MSWPDVFRWFVLALDCFALGTLLALWERIGRFVLPKSAIRLFLLASVMFLVSIAVEIWDRFGEPFAGRTAFSAVALLLYSAGMIELYRWFGTEEGRRQRHDTINEFAVNELHRMANLARALEEDPQHMGRYVQPTLLGRFSKRMFARGGKR